MTEYLNHFHLRSSVMFRLFTPHHRIGHVWELTPKRLQQWGLHTLLLDVDCTLTRYSQEEPLPEVVAWLEQLRLSGFRLCLISNGLERRIRDFAERLDLPCVARAMKPMPWGISRALQMLDAQPSQAAIVGDQLFADVMAGRMAGIRSILVDPIHPEEEPWFTRAKRLPERLLLSRMEVYLTQQPSDSESEQVG